MSPRRDRINDLNTTFTLICILATVAFVVAENLFPRVAWLVLAAQVAVGLAIGSVLAGILAGRGPRRDENEPPKA